MSRFLTCLLAVFCIAPQFAHTSGAIYGTVSYSTASVVAGANITVTNVQTNLARSTASAQDGSYSIPFLAVGTYRVDVDAAGFKKFEQTGIVLDVNRNARV